MKNRKSTSMANLPSPLNAGYSASTPHLFVFQSSDEPDAAFSRRPSSLFHPDDVTLASDVTPTHTRASNYEPDPRLQTPLDAVRPGSVYSCEDPDCRYEPDPRLQPPLDVVRPGSVYSCDDPDCRLTPVSRSPSASGRSESHRDSSPDLSSFCSLPRQFAVGRALVKADAGSLVVSDVDVAQVESFFSGYNTQVVVCRALANMYLSSEAGAWQLRYTGIPALLVDSENGRCPPGAARIQLVLAEKGTGFMLWRDSVDACSEYSAPDPSFHTVRVSSDLRQRAGFSYDDVQAARQFQARLAALCEAHAPVGANSADTCQKQRAKKQRPARYRKEDISQPCCFQHVTRVTLSDMKRFYTLQSLVGPPGLRRMMP